ncbi:MAG: AMP-binding protein, partial [Oscillochloris sp.]|nr:AMP-binding protein [Oscillochloris sp.]
MAATALPKQFNATSYFVDRHCEEQRGERIAVRYEDEQLTYSDVQRLVNQTGNALRADGLRMEERVLLVLLDSPAFIAAFFGAIKIGAVPIPINTNLQPADYAYILNDSRARMVIVSASLLAVISAISEPLLFLQQIIVVGPSADQSLPPSYNLRDFDSWIAAQPADLDPAPTIADDPAFWLYTSGTTGTPKGAVHRHNDMLVCANTYARQVLQIGPDDVTFSVAKLFFAYGLGNGLYFPFAVGATTVLMPQRPEPARVFATIARNRPTLFFSAPTSYAALLAYADSQ